MDTLAQIPAISETKFAVFRYDADHNIGYQLYKENTTAEMTEEEYKQEMLKVVELCRIYKVHNLLADTRNFLFIITPEVQEWTDKYVFATNIYLKKFALIVSEDFISQLALEQVIEDGASASFETRFFSDIGKAQEWIKLKSGK